MHSSLRKQLPETLLIIGGGIVIAAENAIAGKKRAVDYTVVPYAIFTFPQVGSVGLKEEDARGKGFQVKTSLMEIKHVPKAAAIRNTRGFIKTVVDTDFDRLLGMHILSELAAEIMTFEK